MDEQRRELERQAVSGDKEAQHRVDALRLRSGETPSWDYLLSEYRRAIEFQQQHLAKAIEEEVVSFFQKHPPLCGIKSLSWVRGLQEIYDFADIWEIEGMYVDIDDDVFGEYCQITPHGGLDFEASTLISHLKGICNCRASSSDSPVCFIEQHFGENISQEQKQALCNALGDAILIAEKLDKTPRELITRDSETTHLTCGSETTHFEFHRHDEEKGEASPMP